MKYISKNHLLLILYIISITLIYFTLENIKEVETEKFKEKNYENTINKTKQYLKTLILEKKNATLSIGITLASNRDIINFLKHPEENRVNLKSISRNLSKHTNFKNLWFQIISKEGTSLQRSWIDKKGDNLLNSRIDINEMIKNPKVMTTISTGKFDMTYKSMLPVYDEKHNFIGIVEILSHFNSISKKLKKKGIESVFLVDKRYKKQLTHPFTKIFVGDYYVANLDADLTILRHLKKEGVESHLEKFKHNNYHFDNKNHLLAGYYHLPDINGDPMGHLLLYKPLIKGDTSTTQSINSTYNLYIFIGIILLSILFFIIYEINPTIEEEKQQLKKPALLLIIAYLLFSAAIYQLLHYKLDSEITKYKDLELTSAINKYNLIYDKNKEVAEVIYTLLINNQQVLDLIKNNKRIELYHLLHDKYKVMLEKFHIRQIHFHKKDSSSFLRMHRLNKFGDSLKEIRPSVEYVNTYLKAFDGFEEGRIYNGFRYVFPLIDKDNNHLGSVEVSFDAYKFISIFLQEHDIKANFLIRKDIVQKKLFKNEKTNYISSPVPGFYFDKLILEKLKVSNINSVQGQKTQEELLDIKNYILKGEPFIKHFKSTNELVSIIPLMNKLDDNVVGSIHITSNNKNIIDKQFNARLILIVSLIVLSFIFLFIYREIITRLKAENLAFKSKKILDSQESLVIITDGQTMIEANRSLLDYFGYQSIEDFLFEHQCVCEYFEAEEGKNYLLSKIDETTWLSFVLNSNAVHKVKMTNTLGQSKIFKIEHHHFSQDHQQYIISFLDITDIENMNDLLEKKISIAIKENRDKDQIVQEQAKLASMGEMIGAIAHQWRQPLNELNINIQNLDDDYEDGLIDENFINRFIKENRKIILFMSKTIDDFRNFFRIDKINEKFSIKESIESIISIQSAQLKHHNIQLSIDGNDFTINGFKSEFQQVILNIVNNAKDALIQKQIENGQIKIQLLHENSKNKQITITDNAGGIPDHILDRIFEPYFTTKEQGKGTGIGLYMSRMIIETNMNGKINIKNTDEGAEFSIRFDDE